MSILDIFGALMVAGVMGIVGQGARAIIGLKKLNDENAGKPPGEVDIFIASRLFVSLFIGFIAGIAAALALGLKEHLAITTGDFDLLLGIAAAGYAGTDAIEGFVSRVSAPDATGAFAPPAANAPAANITGAEAASLSFAGDVEASVADVQKDVAALKSMLLESSLLAPASAMAAIGDFLDDVTADKVKKMFVAETPFSNIMKHLPSVLGVCGPRDRPIGTYC